MAISLALLRAMAIAGTAVGMRFMTEVVSPETFGEFKLIAAFAALITGVLTSPLNAYAMRAYHDAEVGGNAKVFVTDARRSVLFVGATILILSVPISLIVGAAWGRFPLVIAGVAAAALAVGAAGSSLERAFLVTKGQVIAAGMYEAASAVLLPLAAVVAALGLSGRQSAAMAVAQALTLAVGALVLRRFVRGGPSINSPSTWLRRSMPYAAPLALVGGIAWLFNLGDRYLLAALTTTEEVGRYAAAYGLAALPLASLGGLLPSLAYQPLFRSAAASSESHRQSLARRLLRYQGGLVLAGTAAVILLAPIAVQLLLAEDFREGSVSIIRWVAIGHGFLVAAYALDLDSYSSSKTSRLVVSYTIAVAVGLTLNLVLIPRFGAIGAAQATAASGVAYFGAMLYLNRRPRFPEHDATEGRGSSLPYG